MTSSDRHLEEQLAWIKEAAQRGDAECSFVLGLVSDAGWGGQRSEATAADWYLRAANAGSALGQLAIARMYESGRGIEQSDELAYRFAEMAANQDVVPAQFMVGVFLVEGRGTKRDIAAAQKWLERAAQEGSREAKTYLDLALQEGWLGKKDLRKAFAFTLDLVDNKDPSSICELASKLAEGIGCIKNERKAVELYQKAADLGSHEAAMALSMAYAHGLLGQRIDQAKADRYLKLCESLLDARSHR